MSKSLRSPLQLLLQKQLVDARDVKKLTQVDVAIRLGRPQSFVSKYETGERRLDIVEYCAVVQALDSNPVEFLKELLRQQKKSK